MVTEDTATEAQRLFLDELNLSAALELLWKRRSTRVTVLQKLTMVQRFWRALLSCLGIRVEQGSFLLGNIATPDGESAYLAGRRISGALALRGAAEAVRTEPELQRLNASYGRDTIRLHIAKQSRAEIERSVRSILVAKSLAMPRRCRLFMKRPQGFDPRLMVREFSSVDIRFYGSSAAKPFSIVFLLLRTLVRDLRMTFGGGRAPRLPTQVVRNASVLALQEDTIRADRSRRGQPHWIDPAAVSSSFDTYIIKIPGFTVADSAAVLRGAGVTVLPRSVFRAAVRAKRNHAVIQRIRRDRRKALLALFDSRGGASKSGLMFAAALLRQAEQIGSVALLLNVRVFLVRENYYSLADAMQLIAPDLGVTTVAYQYSSLGAVSTNMLTTADKLLVFSDAYRAVFQTEGIAPREFVTTGYLYGGVDRLVCSKARSHREILKRAGAEFVVCFFDESVQDDRWGLVSREAHLGELHALAAAVLLDPTFGVVVKSQFTFNSPSQLYPRDDLIQRAKASRRYLELMDGDRRNDVYPTEAALVADLCIGHKFGATAALEAAVAGVRVVLLDCYNTRTLWDHLYARADIEYETIEAVLQAINNYRKGLESARGLGDWGEIIHHFDPFRDGKAVDRLRSLVEHCLSASSPQSQ